MSDLSLLRACPLPIRPDPNLILTPICLVAPLPEQFVTPKFEIGQVVRWARFSTPGFGKIIGLVYARGISVMGEGYHYAIALDSNSASREDCAADWAFEDDLELFSTPENLIQG